MESSASLCSAAYTRKSRSSGRALPSCIRKNPGTRAGFCSVAYTVYAKIQEPRQGPAQQRIRKIQEPRQAPAQLCTQKSRNLGSLLFCSVYAKFRNSSRLLFCSVYSIRKNPGAQAGPCPAAYTQKSRSPGRHLLCSVYAKIQELEQASVL